MLRPKCISVLCSGTLLAIIANCCMQQIAEWCQREGLTRTEKKAYWGTEKTERREEENKWTGMNYLVFLILKFGLYIHSLLSKVGVQFLTKYFFIQKHKMAKKKKVFKIS